MHKTSDVYKKLYHYTTWDGLLRILETHSLWGTHCRFLNDYSEIILFRNKLIEFLLPFVLEEYRNLIKEFPGSEQKINASGGLKACAAHDTEAFVNAAYKATGDEIYITSFCGEHSEDEYINQNGLLSQWRGYGKDGGFVLIFDTQKLETVLEKEADKFDYSYMILADVIYSDDEKKLENELSVDLRNIAKYLKKVFMHMKLKKEGVPDSGNNTYHSFVNCISRYKHCGFKEENEVRVVAMPAVQNHRYRTIAEEKGSKLRPDKKREYREKNKMIKHVPYIDLFNSAEINLPIEEIIVGPHKEKETRASALRVMLRDTDIKVTISDIPYIGR